MDESCDESHRISKTQTGRTWYLQVGKTLLHNSRGHNTTTHITTTTEMGLDLMVPATCHPPTWVGHES